MEAELASMTQSIAFRCTTDRWCVFIGADCTLEQSDNRAIQLIHYVRGALTSLNLNNEKQNVMGGPLHSRSYVGVNSPFLGQKHERSRELSAHPRSYRSSRGKESIRLLRLGG